jgi:3-methyladenine DNA glycosylase AlkD
MDKMEKLIGEIKKFCNENGNPAIVKKYSIYFKDGYNAYGVADEILSPQRKVWLEKHKNNGLDWFLDLSDKLIRPGEKYEVVSCGFVFVNTFKKQFSKSILQRVKNWYDDGVDNWAHSDSICGSTIRELVQDGHIEHKDFDKWRISDSKWTRRVVPVAFLEFIRIKQQIKPLIEYIRPIMLDNERVVHQGLGWFLREAWKKEPELVEDFLMEFRNTSARLIFQYATEKMSKEYRLRFRADKKAR